MNIISHLLTSIWNFLMEIAEARARMVKNGHNMYY
jgi:hypothetical protein